MDNTFDDGSKTMEQNAFSVNYYGKKYRLDRTINVIEGLEAMLKEAGIRNGLVSQFYQDRAGEKMIQKLNITDCHKINCALLGVSRQNVTDDISCAHEVATLTSIVDEIGNNTGPGLTI